MRSTAAIPAADTTEPWARLPRYQRSREEHCPDVAALGAQIVPFAEAESAINQSALSAGARALLRGLLRVGTTRVFPGGGLGIEYGSLLKTAARPEYVAAHVAEAAAHLLDRRVDLLLVPGMSGYPIGAMYSLVAGIPAILLKKGSLAAIERFPDPAYPTGAFVIPSYTGDGDVVMHADPPAVADIISGIVASQLAAQADLPAAHITLRAAGADDIIDKATMSHAVGESAVAIGHAAIAETIRRHRLATADPRPITCEVAVVAWVTPLIKGYNHPEAVLRRHFDLTPFAGLNVIGLSLDPAAIAVAGVSGVLAFATP